MKKQCDISDYNATISTKENGQEYNATKEKFLSYAVQIINK